MIVGEISLNHMPVLRPDSTLAEAARALRDAAGGVAAVIDRGRLVGTVSERDLALEGCARGLDPGTATVSEIQDVAPVLCPVDADLKYALRLMRERRQSWLVVTDPAAVPVGVVSLTDLLHVLEDLVPDAATGPEPEYVHRVRGDTAP
jgi:predicted transcriptional regulator